jgi:hypothetical protein
LFKGSQLFAVYGWRLFAVYGSQSLRLPPEGGSYRILKAAGNRELRTANPANR